MLATLALPVRFVDAPRSSGARRDVQIGDGDAARGERSAQIAGVSQQQACGSGSIGRQPQGRYPRAQR